MRKIKLLSVMAASAAFFLSTTCVYAQDPYSSVKGEVNMVNDARYIAPDEDSRRPVPTQSSETTSGKRYETEDSGYADFTGPYLGGDIGYSIGSYDINDPAGSDGDVGLDGFEGGLFVGYGFSHDFSWLGGYAGIELGYEWSKADGDLNGADYEKDHAWVASFRPGVTMYQDALAYGIVGYSRAEFESNGNEENLDGLILGLGSEFNTRSPLKARIEYTYTNYEETKLSGVDFDGHENQIKLGAVFRF